MTDVQISIVIGYKDWGVDRLVGAVRSLKAGLQGIESEIIVSDYGSAGGGSDRSAIEAEGAVYLYTSTDGVWSRSRALNAGLRIARGDILVTTDADMVFTPQNFHVLLEGFAASRSRYFVQQCHDLPEGINHADIENHRYSWDQLVRRSTLRPRWGMGGMIAVPREAYLASRGLDERMQIYGGEDIDFARRMRRLGLALTWLDHPDALMFHVWHPSSRAAADGTEEGRRAIGLNRDIQLKDRTAARNLRRWEFQPDDRPPLVSVVISTFNRAEYLGDAVRSILAQTFRDFELIVVDDGSTDNTPTVLNDIDDPRLRVLRQQNRGLAAARNRATREARGRYIAVMDDDDIALPDRLESELNAITDGANGAFGGWIDYDHATGQRQFWTGKKLSEESLLFNQATFLHPTLMVERRLMLAVPYEETLRSGSDYNMALRMLRSGARFNHCGAYVLMRRTHDGQITAMDSDIQKSSGAITAFLGRANMDFTDVKRAREERQVKDKAAIQAQKVAEPRVLEYLPDGVVARRALVIMDGGAPRRVAEILAGHQDITLRAWRNWDGGSTSAGQIVEDLALSELLDLRAVEGVEVAVESTVLQPSAEMTIAPYLGLDTDLANSSHAHLETAAKQFRLRFPDLAGIAALESSERAVLERRHESDAAPQGGSMGFSVEGADDQRNVLLEAVEGTSADLVQYGVELTREVRGTGITVRTYSMEDFQR